MNPRPPIDEGYIKYRAEWRPGAPPPAAIAARLEAARRPLWDAGLIGHDPRHDVGYGNLSIRVEGNDFVISGTQTGALPTTTEQHYARVVIADIDANRVVCEGPLQASSESLTHAALYALDTEIGAVVHIHHKALWERHRGQLPTTAADIAYGTPEMAREFERLWHDTEFSRERVAVMAGHDDGLISVGGDLDEAAERLLALYRAL